MHRLDRTGKLKYEGFTRTNDMLHYACTVGPVTTFDIPFFLFK